MNEMYEVSLDEKWKNATIANNFIFYKVMHNNPDVCKELLEILLEIKIDKIEMKQEETIEIDYGKKGVRLDVYAIGSKSAYNIEIQTTDTGELPERARYYSSILDVDDLDSGSHYKNLRTNYVIFICIPDIFNKGLAKYTFENLCIENPEIKLNDRSYKYFFIAKNYDKILNERQKSFLKLVTDNSSTGEFSEKISKLVEDAKHNTQWRKQFMDLEREKAFAYQDGVTEGTQKKAIEDAVMLVKEYKETPEVAAQKMEAPLDLVMEELNKSKLAVTN